jgi:hypothetical protein
LAIELAMTSIESSSRSGQSFLKQQCLRRDGYRCVVTGDFDKVKTPNHLGPKEHKDRYTRTECAHILPFALRKFEEKNATQTKNKATIWWALYQYFPCLKGKIGAESINQPQNAMTMTFHLHDEFERFDWALRATEEVCLQLLYTTAIFVYLKHIWGSGNVYEPEILNEDDPGLGFLLEKSH